MTGEILSLDSPFFFSKIDFLISSLVVLYFSTNSNGFFNGSEIHLLLKKNHLEKSYVFFWFPRPF